MKIRKSYLATTLITSLLTLPLSASASKGVDRVNILTIEPIHTASATSPAGDALITAAEVAGTAVLVVGAAVLTGGAAAVAGAEVATAMAAGESAADVALAGSLVATDNIDHSGSPDDLIAHFRATWGDSHISHDLQNASGSDSHRSVKPGQTIQVPSKFGINVVRTGDPKHMSYRYANLKLTEYDSGSKNDDLGTLNIPSYAYMKKYGKKDTKVTYVNDNVYIATTTVKSPSSGDDHSIYQISYLVETDGGDCKLLSDLQVKRYRKYWNKLEIYCKKNYFY